MNVNSLIKCRIAGCRLCILRFHSHCCMKADINHITAILSLLQLLLDILLDYYWDWPSRSTARHVPDTTLSHNSKRRRGERR